MSNAPENLRYSAEHEWVNSDNPARIGVTQFAVDSLGDVVYVELPDVGQTITAGDVVGEIESTKSVSDLYTPVSGKVVETNEAAVSDPSMVGEDPYGTGWLFTVEVTDEGKLMSAAEYLAANAS